MLHSMITRGMRLVVDRRRLLQVGGLGCLGLSLSKLLEAEAAGPRLGTQIRSCILLTTTATEPSRYWIEARCSCEIRGEFRPIATSVPRIHIGEHAAALRRVMDKLASFAACHHPMRNHNSAAVESLCGRTPLTAIWNFLADDANSFPCYGAALAHLERRRDSTPSHVRSLTSCATSSHCLVRNAGFLGAATIVSVHP